MKEEDIYKYLNENGKPELAKRLKEIRDKVKARPPMTAEEKARWDEGLKKHRQALAARKQPPSKQ